MDVIIGKWLIQGELKSVLLNHYMRGVFQTMKMDLHISLLANSEIKMIQW